MIFQDQRRSEGVIENNMHQTNHTPSSPQKSISCEVEEMIESARNVPERTLSISSTSSYKMDRPSYTYSIQSTHGMNPYGIADHAAVAVGSLEDDGFGENPVN